MTRSWKKGRLAAVIILSVLCFVSFCACSHFKAVVSDPSLSTVWFEEMDEEGHIVTATVDYQGWPIFRFFVPATLYVSTQLPGDDYVYPLFAKKIMYNHKDNQYHLEWTEDGFALNLQCAKFDPMTYHFKWEDFWRKPR